MSKRPYVAEVKRHSFDSWNNGGNSGADVQYKSDAIAQRHSFPRRIIKVGSNITVMKPETWGVGEGETRPKLPSYIE